MSEKTGIQWTDATWNPVTGCTKISPGCANCYAETMATRLRAMGSDRYKNGFDVRCHDHALRIPFKWKSARRVFVNSMSDLFHECVPMDFIYKVWRVMEQNPRHTFQVLTKRPDRMRDFLWGESGAGADVPALHNVWLGVSAEDQQRAELRIPTLLQCPAAVRFVSIEPMLGPVDIGMSTATCDCCDRWSSRWVRLYRPVGPDLPRLVNAKEDMVADSGAYLAHSNKHGALSVQTPGGLLGIRPSEFECLPSLDWVIVGGESGPKARPMHIDWVRGVRDQCAVAGVPFFFKQWGGTNKKNSGRLLDGRTHDDMPHGQKGDK